MRTTRAVETPSRKRRSPLRAVIVLTNAQVVGMRLRIITAADITVFCIDAGAMEGRLAAVDGNEVQPVAASVQPFPRTINAQTCGNHIAATVRTGHRMAITFHNMAQIAHPTH